MNSPSQSDQTALNHSPGIIMRLKIGTQCYLVDNASTNRLNVDLSAVILPSNQQNHCIDSNKNILHQSRFIVDKDNNILTSNNQDSKLRHELKRTNHYRKKKTRRSNTIPRDVIRKNPINHLWTRSTIEKIERYSIGDYLRQQILQDLSSMTVLIGKSEKQIAEDRYNRIKKYLNKSDDNRNKKLQNNYYRNNYCRNCSRRSRSQSDINVKLICYWNDERKKLEELEKSQNCYCNSVQMARQEVNANGNNFELQTMKDNDMATNYFRRVYEFLKQQPRQTRSASAMGKWSYIPNENNEDYDNDDYEKSDTSSSGYSMGDYSYRRINNFQGEIYNIK